MSLFFNYQYMRLTEEYIRSLTDFYYKGWWFYDLFDKGIFYYYYKQLQNHIICKIPGRHKGIIPNELTYCSHPSEEKFLKHTRKYVSELMRAANPQNLPYLEIDQIVPSQNINRILRFFEDDIYVFIVDRDPRDLYILAKFLKQWPICPSNNVNQFCDWFLYTRQSGSLEIYDSAKVKRIRFEDLIYRYEKTVKEIEEMIGLDSKNHMASFMKLNPMRSVNNTQIWKKYHIEEDISVIEKRLSDYLYPFDEVKGLPILGTQIDDNRSF